MSVTLCSRPHPSTLFQAELSSHGAVQGPIVASISAVCLRVPSAVRYLPSSLTDVMCPSVVLSFLVRPSPASGQLSVDFLSSRVRRVALHVMQLSSVRLPVRLVSCPVLSFLGRRRHSTCVALKCDLIFFISVVLIVSGVQSVHDG